VIQLEGQGFIATMTASINSRHSLQRNSSGGAWGNVVRFNAAVFA